MLPEVNCVKDTLSSPGHMGMLECATVAEGRRIRAPWKLDDEFKIPQHHVPALHCIKVPQRLHHAPAKGQVQYVVVFQCPGIGAKIEGRAREDGANEWTAEVGAVESQADVVFPVVVVQSRCPQAKRLCEAMSKVDG